MKYFQKIELGDETWHLKCMQNVKLDSFLFQFRIQLIFLIECVNY